MEEIKRRYNVWLPLLFSLVMILGMIFGFNLHDSLRNKRDLQEVMQRNDRLEEIIQLIKEKYVDTVNTDMLYGDAVNGILKHLDPHTIYIPAEELISVNEDLEGSFFGIGIEFSIVRDTIQVTSVVTGGPAEHAGVDVGDELIRVNDTVVAGNNITSDKIVHMLRGKQHTNVNLTLRTPMGEMKKATLGRDVVPVYSVDAAVMLDSITGYIKIERFSATTYDEFMSSMKQLQSSGMKQLVLDLRDNPGGYLEAATALADEFLDDSKLIVYTQGRNSPRSDYKATKPGKFEKGKLTILVDESSASASEILSGAVQDWDRGIIIGRRTFGKGLVQEQFVMDDGSALRLTIAKYYTPSGRSIQRTYANGKEAYEKDFEHRFEDGELTVKDTIKPADTTRYYTSKHRSVYGGGGITPDIYVPYDTAKLSTGMLSMLFSDELKTIVWDFYITNRNILRFRNVVDYDLRFNAEGQLADKYFAGLRTDKDKEAAKKIWSNPKNFEYFRLHIKAQLARYLFHNNGYFYIVSKDDDALQRAINVMSSAEYLKLISR